MSDSPIPFELIERHVSGDIGDGERARLEEWVAESAVNARAFDDTVAELGSVRPRGKYDSDKGWDRMQHQITSGGSSRSGFHNWRYVSIAAAIVFAVIGVRYVSNPVRQGQLSKTYSTASGERATVTLADGSVAVLAPATQLTVKGRDVDLHGEAIFTVTRHAEAPFTVTANGTMTKVLGTTFGVRAYDNDLRIAVAEGKVAVDNATLSTGDVAFVAPGSHPIVNRGENISEMLAWAQGRLVFRLVTLREIIPDLERWYGVDIQVGNEDILDKKLTITLTDEPVAQAVRVIGLALGVRPEMHGKTILLGVSSH